MHFDTFAMISGKAIAEISWWASSRWNGPAYGIVGPGDESIEPNEYKIVSVDTINPRIPLDLKNMEYGGKRIFAPTSP
jgi:hypothetical protein